MKKLSAVFLLAILAALVPAGAQVDPPAAAQGNVAVGPIYSLNFLGLESPLQGFGITGKLPGLAPIFGLNFSFSAKDSRYFFGATADWILYKRPIYEPFNLNFYMGPGLYFSSLFATDGRVDLGLRIPVGINWVPVKFFETFVELTPAFGITFRDPIAPGWLLQGAIGARVWF